MDRREALKRTALIMGGIVSAPTILGILNGCTAKHTIDWKPVFFTEDQGILISDLAEIIIPKTDTPGAKEVGVPGFIELMVKDVLTQKERDQFMTGLKTFDEDCKKNYGHPFIEINNEQQTAFVKKIHDAAIAGLKPGPDRDMPFVLKVKELTVAGYFTSEIGATKVLQYEAVPGAYHGCLPLSEAGNGKTWATS